MSHRTIELAAVFLYYATNMSAASRNFPCFVRCAIETQAVGAASPVRETYPPFEKLRASIDAAKCELDRSDLSRDAVAQALKLSDTFSGLRGRILKRGRVSNAWLKFYEMVVELDLLRGRPAGAPPISIFFNAELPGSFILAATHYAKAYRGSIEWCAASWIDPGASSSTLGDEYGLVRDFGDRWLMGGGVSGDVTQAREILQLEARAKKIFPDGVDLYTSDAGLELQGDYLRQEELSASLNLGQMILGVFALKPGGTMLTKTFTFTRRFSLSVLCIFSSMFERFSIVKPRTSRAANSEVYVLGEGFRGIDDASRKLLLDALEAPLDMDRPLIEGTLSTLTSLYKAALRIHGELQVEALKKVVALAAMRRGFREAKDRLNTERSRHCDKWIMDILEPRRSAVVGGVERRVGGWGEYEAERRRAVTSIAASSRVSGGGSAPAADAHYPGRSYISALDAAESLLAARSNAPLLQAVEALGAQMGHLETRLQSPSAFTVSAVIPSFDAADVKEFVTASTEPAALAAFIDDVSELRADLGGGGKPAAPVSAPALPSETADVRDAAAVRRLEELALPYVNHVESLQATAASVASDTAEMLRARPV